LVDAGIEYPFEDISDELAVRHVSDGPHGRDVSAKRLLSGREEQCITVPTPRVSE
jgi:hypothetical protein